MSGVVDNENGGENVDLSAADRAYEAALRALGKSGGPVPPTEPLIVPVGVISQPQPADLTALLTNQQIRQNEAVIDRTRSEVFVRNSKGLATQTINKARAMFWRAAAIAVLLVGIGGFVVLVRLAVGL